jgi:valyl-tRNA synthetase
MDKAFKPSVYEQTIYKMWEEKGLFKAATNSKKKPFSIILPPPNANADLHLGHAMYVFEDIMIRYHRMRGYETLWLPGADHAGFETQYVFEKQLQKEGKSRLDFDRKTLYSMIWDFVMKNKGNMVAQLKKLGFALDWRLEKFTLDEDTVKIVYQTFKKLYDEGLIYRDLRLVNYCVRCGTSFSDLEVNYIERPTPLYYLKYGPFTLATTRPETKFGDTAVAVNPKDKRYKKWIGKTIEVDGLIGKFKLKVIADDFVDPKFGTGVVKVTPAHDWADFETGRRHNLEVKQVIGFDGKLNKHTGRYEGLFVTKARKAVIEDLQKAGLIEKIKEDYEHRIGVCYKCGTAIEPLPLKQWFVKVRPLADNAKKLVEKDEIKIYPKRFKKIIIQWLDNFHDWNISRQLVWGIRIPAYKCKSKDKWFVSVTRPVECEVCAGSDFKQDEDTFDTWFSSAQWPFATLKTSPEGFYEYFYPTSVMETGYDILPWWVARMIMIGYFATGKVPFKTVFLHGMVRDKKGQKMSKSRGNVINPIEMIEKYGADAFRASLVFGVAEGADLSLSDEKVIGMRNFTNKIWNIGRFIEMNRQTQNSKSEAPNKSKILIELQNEFKKIKKDYFKYMDSFRFSMAIGIVYEFLWHRFADFYIEELKEAMQNGNIEAYNVMSEVYLEGLKMLHPFMPFLTEAIWQEFRKNSIYETDLSA